MKKTLHILFLTSVATLLAVSCSREETLSPESVITVPAQTKNDFDKWLEANYVNPYNIEFKYRYELSETQLSYYTIPSDFWSCVQMAHLVKYSCIDSYDEVAGISFTRKYFPKQFYLQGEWQYKNNGSFTLGTAEGGKKIFLMGLNYLSKYIDDADELNHYYLKTIHHEFTHILNQTTDYPTSFRQVTPSSYVSDSQFSEPFVSTYLERGFITAYAQTNSDEDFAEMISEYVTHDADWWDEQMEAADDVYEGDPNQAQTGRVLIEQKLDIARAYMHNTWGIDIDKLRDTILRRQGNVTSGKIDLTDLTINEPQI